ncbi:MAG TPA: AbrB/MazE/SpoVT family DNA-binding domain-containing protein [Thermopetrobacter sp.]|nr:AbrB/MazE/SpoVT family DNA-binding domain-containing protein [Thermopetrobacter sp.]
MHKLKLVRVGNSTAVVLPKEVLHRLRAERGDVLYLTETPDGYRLVPHDPEFARQMEEARRLMKQRRNALRALAR